MKNNFLFNDFIAQKGVAFKNYTFYKNVGILNKTENEHYSFEYLLKHATFNRVSYLPSFKSVLLDDLKKFSNYMHLTIDELITLIRNNEIIPSKKHDDVIVVSKDCTDNFQSYELNETSNLYTELAKVEPFNEKSIINFSKTFGLPFGYITSPKLRDRAYDIEYMFTPTVNYLELNLMLMKYRSVFLTLTNILTKNIDAIKDRVYSEYKIDRKLANTERDIEMVNYFFDEFRKMSENEILEAEDLLFVFTGGKQVNIFDFVVDYNDGNLAIRKQFMNLFEVAYTQIFTALMNKVNF